MALGEMIGTEKGTVTAFRVTKDGFGVKVESQFQGQGEMLGIPFVDYATYWSVYRPDGNSWGPLQPWGPAHWPAQLQPAR